MKIDKAIEILEDILHHVEPGDSPDEHDAVKLGIEALKFFEKHRQDSSPCYPYYLPGETKD